MRSIARFAVPVLLAAAASAALAQDSGKREIEVPTERVIERSREGVTLPSRPSPEFANPRVAPGKVRWHADLATARAAAKKSGKPVMLFQLLGRLDEEFC